MKRSYVCRALIAESSNSDLEVELNLENNFLLRISNSRSICRSGWFNSGSLIKVYALNQTRYFILIFYCNR